MSFCWAKRFLGRRCGRTLHAALAVLIFSTARPASAQQNLPPAVEDQMAAGVEALKSGDLATAEKIFSDPAPRGVKHPLGNHNLGALTQQRGNQKQAPPRLIVTIARQPRDGPWRQ